MPFPSLEPILPALYKDLAQPTIQKVGKALSGIVGIVTTPFEIGGPILQKNIKNYVRKIESYPIEKIVAAPPEIAVPILEKLKYVRSEELSEFFTELLTRASVIDSANFAHPSYIEIISSLSGDEAKILARLKNLPLAAIPFLEIRYSVGNENAYNIHTNHFTNFFEEIGLNFPENKEVYIGNLLRLGIFNEDFTRSLNIPQIYAAIEETAAFVEIKSQVENQANTRFHTHKGTLLVTDFAKQLINTICV